MKQSEKKYKRIVIKIGSSLFSGEKSGAGEILFSQVTDQISALLKLGKEVVIVSSGAIALGMSKLGLKSRPKKLAFLQAAAAIGQNILMEHYTRAFKKHKINCAQVLLTWEDFNDRKRYLNARQTLLTLLKMGTIPIVNENDTVSTEEIKFGDNDRLSGLVARSVKALLIILTDVDGLLDKNKKLRKVIPEINDEVMALARSSDKQTSVGGMITKLEAARTTSNTGLACVFANGGTEQIIVNIAKDPFSEGNWTCVLPKENYLSARECWMGFSTKTKGKVMVDDGAKNALLNKKSLLSVGVINVEGHFEAGDIISVVDKQNSEIARGKAGFSSKQLEEVRGKRFDKEVIHRDNIVIL